MFISGQHIHVLRFFKVVLRSCDLLSKAGAVVCHDDSQGSGIRYGTVHDVKQGYKNVNEITDGRPASWAFTWSLYNLDKRNVPQF